jgi:hypothetical protein
LAWNSNTKNVCFLKKKNSKNKSGGRGEKGKDPLSPALHYGQGRLNKISRGPKLMFNTLIIKHEFFCNSLKRVENHCASV